MQKLVELSCNDVIRVPQQMKRQVAKLGNTGGQKSTNGSQLLPERMANG